MRMSNKPTHGTPLTELEREAGTKMRSGNVWWGGARFEYTSQFGSSSSNTGDKAGRKKGGGAKMTTAGEVPRRVIRPRWARKYEESV